MRRSGGKIAGDDFRKRKTAFIEPVSTREKYQRRGIGTAMMHGVMLRCKDSKIFPAKIPKLSRIHIPLSNG